MNNLLWISLIIALLYYFFIYLPSQKSHLNPDPPNNRFTHPKPKLNNPEDEVKFPVDEFPVIECPGAVSFPGPRYIEYYE